MPREPIDAAELARAIAPWRLDARQETGSTNADAAEAARAGAPEGLVVTAESQTAGRGRLGRAWVSPPRAGLALSILVRPAVEIARWGWLPLLAGLALADTVSAVLGEQADAGLKWPNDLLVGGRKCAGILVEAVGGGAVVGVGLNVSLREHELPPTPTGLPATSLLLAGAGEVDRTALAAALVRRFRERYTAWRAGDDVRHRYLARCLTVGRDVRIVLPGDGVLAGAASTVDEEGRLVVRSPDGRLCPIAAGDVTHVR